MMVAGSKQGSGQMLSGLLQGISDLPDVDDVQVSGIASDSRMVKRGDLFIAYQNPDIVSYVQSAVVAGAGAVLMEAAQVQDIPKYSIPVIALPELRVQAGLIAAKLLSYPTRDLHVVGVTGTNGKTTLTHLIAQAFELQHGGSSALIGTLGYGVVGQLEQGPNTTPEAVTLQNIFARLRRQGINKVAMEVSSHGLDQHRVVGTEFDIAVFTNLSRDHLDYHGTMDAYMRKKRQLFNDYPISGAVINLDDEYGRQLFKELQQKMQPIGYTLRSDHMYEGSIVSARIIKNDPAGMELEVTSPWGNGILRSTMFGVFNASNLLGSVPALCLSGLSFADILSISPKCHTAPGRMEFCTRAGKPTVVIDYAHTPDSLLRVLQELRSLSIGKLIIVFGCGGQRDKGKRSLMGQVAARFADHIFLTNDNPRNESPQEIIEDIANGIKQPAQFSKIIDRYQAITMALQYGSADDVVLIAGKGNEEYQQFAEAQIPFNDRQCVQEILDNSAELKVQ